MTSSKLKSWLKVVLMDMAFLKEMVTLLVLAWEMGQQPVAGVYEAFD